MEFVARREDILTPLAHAAAHAESKGAMPAIRCVALRAAADGTLKVESTDLVRSYRGAARVEVKRSGGVAVGAADLLAQVNAFPVGSEITFTADPSFALKLSAKKIRATLAGISPDDMPTIPDVGGTPVTIEAAALAALLTQVRAAMSGDATRPHLNAVCFAGRDVIATNGHCLHKTVAPVDLPKVLIPADAVEAWRAAVKDLKGEVTLRATTAVAPVALETPDGVFATKTVDAAFPSWEQVVPRDQPWAIEFSAGEMRAATKVMPTGMTHIVAFSLETDLAGAALVIEGQNDGRSKRAEVSCKVLRGAGEIPSKWGANLAYVLDAVSVADAGAVILEGHGELDPLSVRIPAIEGFVAVVMPGRV